MNFISVNLEVSKILNTQALFHPLVYLHGGAARGERKNSPYNLIFPDYALTRIWRSFCCPKTPSGAQNLLVSAPKIPTPLESSPIH